MDSQNFVEGGWFADPAAGYSNPTVYYLWMNRGATNGTIPYTGYILTMNTDRVFTIENVGDIGIFRFFVDDEQNPYAYSPMMDFQNGYIQTNSERWNSCDSMWAHFYDLNYYNTVTWTSSYDDLECYTTTAGGYFFNKISNSEHTINQFSGDTC